MDSEQERCLLLLHKMQRHSIQLEDFLQPGYNSILIHSSSTIIKANQAMADLVGYTTGELQGLNAWCLFPPHSATLVAAKLAAQSEEPYKVYARRKDGREILTELKGINFDIAGEPARAILARLIPENNKH